MTWYKESELKEYIENLILASYLHKKDFEKAENPARAQLWIVAAILAKRIGELEKEIKLLKTKIERGKKTVKKKRKS